VAQGPAVNRPPHEIVELAERIVLQTLPKRASPKALARAAGVSIADLHHAFRIARGAPLYSALMVLRLEAADQMLQVETPMTAEAVALQCGFGHYGVFHRNYRLKFGREPGGGHPVAVAERRSFIPNEDEA
jgi:transcriptional regulator GlxA family with amidase domain